MQRREHPALDIDAAAADAGVEEHTGGAGCGEMPAEGIGARRRRRKIRAVPDLGKHEEGATGRDAGAVVAEFDGVDRKRAGVRDRVGCDLLAHGERLRCGQPCPCDIGAIPDQIDRHQPGLLLEDQAIAGDGPAVALSKASQHERGADIRVAGERHFGAGREDPDLRRVRRILRRQHEGGFRQVEFGGDRLHLRGRKSLGIAHHGKRVAAELLGGEHVDGGEVQALRHGGSHRLVDPPSMTDGIG